MFIMLIILLCFLFFLLPAFLIQYFSFRLEFGRTLRWAKERPGMLLASALSCWALFCVLLGICDRPLLAGSGVLLFTLVAGYANYLMQTLRSCPIVPLDMVMALNMGKVLQMLPLIARLGIGVGAVASAGLAALLLHIAPALGCPPPVRLALAVVGFFLFSGFFFAGKDRNPLRKLLLLLGADFDTYLQNGDAIASYDHNGYLPAFFSNCGRPLMDKSADYTPERIAEICGRYEYPSPRAIAARTPHILFIMSESFSDPTRIPGIRLSEDPIPFVRSVMGRCPSGQILAPGYGGSTAHCEFEALTGFSTGLVGGNSSFECNVSKHSHFPAFPRRLLDSGYQTTALHPYRKGMYARDEAYAAMGIQRFIDVSGMAHTGKIDNNPYVCDREAYAEVLELLRDGDIPQFIHLVTMQNHGGYSQKNRFRNTIRADGIKESYLPALETYVQGLRYTDEATRFLLRELEGLGHPVLVVFWGDHLPGVYPHKFMDGKLPEKYETPFFLWANYPLDKQSFGTVSAGLLPMLIAKAARIPATPFDRLLESLQEQLPAINSRFSLDKDRKIILPDQLAANPPEAYRHLKQIQYDTMLGEGYAQRLGFFRIMKEALPFHSN